MSIVRLEFAGARSSRGEFELLFDAETAREERKVSALAGYDAALGVTFPHEASHLGASLGDPEADHEVVARGEVVLSLLEAASQWHAHQNRLRMIQARQQVQPGAA